MAAAYATGTLGSLVALIVALVFVISGANDGGPAAKPATPASLTRAGLTSHTPTPPPTLVVYLADSAAQAMAIERQVIDWQQALIDNRLAPAFYRIPFLVLFDDTLSVETETSSFTPISGRPPIRVVDLRGQGP